MCNFYANEMSFFENLSPAEYNVTVLLIGESSRPGKMVSIGTGHLKMFRKFNL
jgi:hypothetical protein